jgi:hypothetical protein
MPKISERSIEESPRPKSFIKSEEAFENDYKNQEDISSYEEELEDEFDEGDFENKNNQDEFLVEINEKIFKEEP